MSRETLDNYLQACREWRGGAPTDPLLEASRALMSLGDAGLLAEAVRQMPALPPDGAAWVAVTCGSAVEDGAPVAEMTGPAIFDLFTGWVQQIPGDEARLAAFPLLCNAVVSHLAHLPAHRERMRDDDALTDRLTALQAISEGATWVCTALMMHSGTLRVLHPGSGKGFRLRYRNVPNCFHLFSLIQAAIGTRLPGGRTPDPAVVAVAKGRANDMVNDSAWWHYGHAGSATPDLAASIWGEAPVDTIPDVNGEKLVLLWSQVLESRSWDAGFLTPHLAAMPSDLDIEHELDQAECQALIQQLGIRADADTPATGAPPKEAAKEATQGAAKKWWKPW